MSTRVDRILRRLYQAEEYERNTPVKLDNSDLTWLCGEAIKEMKAEPIMLKLQAPLTICGDIHGQFYDLLKFLNLGGRMPETSYLFLGDYVDRGKNSIETFSLLLALKVKYPHNIWLLRGNHETAEISRQYGFFAECASRYNQALWQRFTEVFRWLPLAAIISDRIFCVHGGLSPELTNLTQISKLQRPLDIPEAGMLTDILWSDPSNDHNGYHESERGTSYTYGPDVVNNFLKQNDFDLLCRAHQVVDAGYQFPFMPQQTVLTMFSAPDYCEEFGNRGAMLKVDASLKCKFEFIDSPPKLQKLGTLNRPTTPYNRY